MADNTIDINAQEPNKPEKPNKNKGGHLGQVKQDAAKAAKKSAEDLEAIKSQYRAAINKVIKAKRDEIMTDINNMPTELVQSLGREIENSDSPEYFRTALTEINQDFLETFGVDAA